MMTDNIIPDKLDETELPLEREEEKIKNIFLNSMDSFIKQRRAIEKRWREADLMARGKSVGHYYKGQSKVTVPLVHNAIRSVASRLRDVLWGRRVNFDMLPTKGVLGDEADANKQYIVYQLGHLGQEQEDFYNIFYDFCWAVCTFGKSFLKTYWNFVKGKKKRRIWRQVGKRDKFGKLISVDYKPMDIKVDEKLYDGLMIENPNIFDIYMNASIHKLNLQPIMIHKTYIPWRTLWGRFQKGIYKNIKKEIHKKWTRPEYHYERDYSKLILIKAKGVENVDVKLTQDEYEVLEGYFWYTGEDGEEKFCMGSMLIGPQEGMIIQYDEFPYMYGMQPFVDANLEKDLFVAYGWGLPDLNRENQIEANDNRRQIMDAKTFSLNHMWLWDASSGIAPSYLTSEPNKVIPTQRVDGIKPLPTDPNVINVGILAEKLAKESIQETSMSPASHQGMPTRYGTTATEATQILGEANVAIVDVAKNIEKSALEPLLRRAHSMNRQFILKEQVVFVLGKKGLSYPVTIKPWEMREDVNFVATGSLHMQNKVLVAQQMINLLNSAFVQNLPPGSIKIGNVLELIFQGWDVPNIDRYIDMEAIEGSLDPSEENILLNQGQKVEVSKADRDMEHLVIHYVGRKTAPEEAYATYDEHIAEHEKSYRSKTAELERMSMIAGQGGNTTGQSPKTQVGALRQTEKLGAGQTRRGTIS